MMNSKVSIIGAGSWGTALALVMARHSKGEGPAIPIWGHDPEHIAAMQRCRSNEKYLKGVEFPASIRPTNSLSDCAGAAVLFLAVPSEHLASVAEQLSVVGIGADTIIVSCTKGIEQRRGLLMSEVIAEKLPSAIITVLSGPNLAGKSPEEFPLRVSSDRIAPMHCPGFNPCLKGRIYDPIRVSMPGGFHWEVP